MIEVLLVPLLALFEGLAQGPYQLPDADFGRAYSFEIPVSNPDNIKLAFKQTSGEIALGIRVEESGLLEGKPMNAGSETAEQLTGRAARKEVVLCPRSRRTQLIPMDQ